ncbi:MAG: sigma-70 family RNA polymerase sigma factor [Deltaproteobacteria bacterium]|nr:sigma-70 family RNA polymerase sigma factor [Deltaproteobacteria bacterium]
MPGNSARADSTVFETIYRKHYGLVRWVLRARGVGDAAIDDAVHDVFLAVHRRLPERDPDQPLRTWIAGLARNVGFSHRRSAARERNRIAQLADPPSEPLPDELLARRRAWVRLTQFLDGLGPEQREVFLMVDVAGMRVSDLAATMGVPANTLHSRLKVARTHFTHHFESKTDTDQLRRRAREHARPRAQSRRRTWSMLAASVPALTPPSAPLGWAIAAPKAWALVGTLAVTGTVALVVVGPRSSRASAPAPLTTATPTNTARSADTTRPPATAGMPPSQPNAAHATAPSPRPPGPTTVPAQHPAAALSGRSAPRPTAPVHPSARPSSVDRPKPTDVPAAPADLASVTAAPDVGLAHAVRTLQRARGHLRTEQPRRALALLDTMAEVGPLARDRDRLVLDAACRIGNTQRATAAARALAQAGVSIETARPCPQKNGSGKPSAAAQDPT